MRTPSRFELLFGAIMLVGALVLWPQMRQLRAIDRCLDDGNSWNYSIRKCVPPIAPRRPAGSGIQPAR